MIKKKVKKEIPANEVFREDVSDLEIAKKMIKIYQSAQDRKLKFDLSFESVKELLSYQTCYYTNKPFEADGVFARSFDRIDSNEGYVEGNVVACTHFPTHFLLIKIAPNKIAAIFYNRY